MGSVHAETIGDADRKEKSKQLASILSVCPAMPILKYISYKLSSFFTSPYFGHICEFCFTESHPLPIIVI